MSLAIVGTSPAYTLALCIEKAWIVCVECADCDRPPARWTDKELMGLPGGATLAQVADRATCRGCGSKRGRLFTRQGAWGARAALARDYPDAYGRAGADGQ